MDLKGEYRLAASRETVWDKLNDPEVLKRCIPGCQELEKTGDNEMKATVTAKVGPVKATFNGEVRLENITPPESYSIVGEGKGGIAGFAKGGADVHLTDEGNETLLTYEVKAQVGGKLAQLGGRLIDSSAKKLSGQFFDNFAKEVEAAESGDNAA
ncbi:carbon monoxide dehydrogenase subunit G [Jiella sp. MQZ9-1]|uniref:Carbon monoxide dehydrogenase subunit G n=1 Tax=Jiella flava TaxID=2816857 RepID=A0A939FW72_9HYPH|nr:carbon monoxide dehydrogenase subunit G [Jiella flava]MBO0661376.1 carbon monoxide dehydrogenase subunit G [Jiella flava]MCD2470021.1 carbon monoxide dehydrogenase subunit G [Jiella flava]